MAMTFNVSVNGDKAVLDMNYLPDPFQYSFRIDIQNQSTQDLYFKISTSSTDWSIVTPSNGELGVVAAGSTESFMVTLQRAKPTADTTDTVPITIDAYTDSGYTNQVDTGSTNLTITIADLRNWANSTLYNFDDGTSQGWTLGSNWSVANDISVESGGYSLKMNPTADSGAVSDTITLSSASIPSNAQVVISLMLAAKILATANNNGEVDMLTIKVGTDTVYQVPLKELGYWTSDQSSTLTKNWVYIGADITPYAGQTADITIQVDVTAGDVQVWIDDIIIAGNG